MNWISHRGRTCFLAGVCVCARILHASENSQIGREVAVPVHLQDGEEYQRRVPDLIEFGRKLFTARWTAEEGAGRPLTKGTGSPMVNPFEPLVFPRNFNRISGPDTNSCAGCRNLPDVGGGGDIVGNVFVLGQRFDSATFDRLDSLPTGGALDERGLPVTLQTIANSGRSVCLARALSRCWPVKLPRIYKRFATLRFLKSLQVVSRPGGNRSKES